MQYLLLVLGASAGFMILAFALFVALDSFRNWIVGLGFGISSKLYTLSKRIRDRKRIKVSSVSASKIVAGTIESTHIGSIDSRRISSVTIKDGQIKVSPGFVQITHDPNMVKTGLWENDLHEDNLLRRNLLGTDDEFRDLLEQESIRRRKAQEVKDGGSAA